jgi:NAD(P)-dependent dehydrogenase (short-subunit alcohol dehydrogenase family)
MISTMSTTSRENTTNQRHGVLISGASTGIGLATALLLSEKGYTVWAGVRKTEDAEQVQLLSNHTVQPVILDVTKQQDIEAALQVIETAALKNLDGFSVINNAGIVCPGPVECLPVEAWREQFEINLFGAAALTQACLPLMRKLSFGRIVNISSISGRASSPFVGAYAASKFALEAMSDALRMELHPTGIKVILIEPGVIATPIWEKSGHKALQLAESLPPQIMDYYQKPYQVLEEMTQQFNAKGLSPLDVAKVIEHALSVKHPKHRYLIGTDAKMRALSLMLPTPVQDWFLLKLLKHRGLND